MIYKNVIGGTVEIEDGTPDSFYLEAEESMKAPANPKKEGYEFGGFFSDEACTTAFDFSTVTADTINKVIYVKFTLVTSDTRTIGFKASEIDDDLVADFNGVKDAGGYVETDNVIYFKSSKAASKSTYSSVNGLNFGGKIDGNNRILYIDLRGYTGNAEITLGCGNTGGSAGDGKTRMLYITKTAQGAESTAIEGLKLATPSKSVLATESAVTVQCGNIYYLMSTDTVGITELTVKLDFKAKVPQQV